MEPSTCDVDTPDYSEEIDEEERINFYNIIAAFRCYRANSLNHVNRKEAYLNSLPGTHQTMLANYRDHLQKVRYCIEANYKVKFSLRCVFC